MKVTSIVGARPQFVKLAPFHEACKLSGVKHSIIHTGQHYDYNMSKLFFDQLKIPRPDYSLGIGSFSHGKQTGRMMVALETVLIKEKPDWAVVYGDTNSTLAGALVCAKLNIPLAHIEAGLRSYNRNMPEEINRILTDRCSSVLLCPTKNAVNNLRKEGFKNIVNHGELIRAGGQLPSLLEFPAVINTGDVMYDSIRLLEGSINVSVLKNFQVTPKKYFLLTIHRAENTDDPDNFKNILKCTEEISKILPVLFPAHPRVKRTLMKTARRKKNKIMFSQPVGYHEMLALEKHAAVILTDSGGLQKEAYFLRVPCVTLRNETEWKETTESGWNEIAGTDADHIAGLVERYLEYPPQGRQQPLIFGDGKAAERILRILKYGKIF